jgi:hypothetical protein
VKTAFVVICCVSMLSFFTSPAQANTLFAVDYPQSATFYTVNQSTGALTAVGPVGLDNIGDLTSDQGSTVYGVQITTNSLVTINQSNGAGTLGPAITGTAGGFPIVSLAYDPFTAVLYGNTSVPFGGATVDQLYSINTTTGAATSIGTIQTGVGPLTSIFALGFGQNGNLYGVDGSNNLDLISTTNAGATIVGGTGLTAVYDIASDPTTGTMYAASTGTNSLYTLDLTTGASTLVGPYGSPTNVVGLAFVATPEPSALILLTTGMALMLFAARRKLRVLVS